MDYQLHFIFEDSRTSHGKSIIKRYEHRSCGLIRYRIKCSFILCFSFEAVKPLGRVEILPSPYVTESTRIAILLPTFEHQIAEAMDFVTHYEKTCMEHQDNTFLMMVRQLISLYWLQTTHLQPPSTQVLLYQSNSPSKSRDDVFYTLKDQALKLSEKYKNDGSRIAWVSIRLTEKFSGTHPNATSAMLNSVYGKQEILSLVMTDLALRKIGLENLVMVASNAMTFKADFLNRVSGTTNLV